MIKKEIIFCNVYTTLMYEVYVCYEYIIIPSVCGIYLFIKLCKFYFS